MAKYCKRVSFYVSIFLGVMLWLCFPGESYATNYVAYSSLSDGYIENYSTVSYSAAHDAATGSVSSSEPFSYIGQSRTPAPTRWGIRRSFLFFDTSFIPGDAIIESAFLTLYGSGTYTSSSDFDVTISTGQPTYPHDPLVAEDYLLSQYSGNGGTLNTADWKGEVFDIQPNIINLNALGLSWIQTGTGALTNLALLSSRDINGLASSGNEYVAFETSEAGEADYRPTLEITYTQPEVVPEPVSIVLLGIGLAGISVMNRKKGLN